MKNYYYNPKTRDLMIFDAEGKEMLVLERIEGIRVLTSSEIDQPTNFRQEDPARETRGKKADTSFSEGERDFSKKIKRAAKAPTAKKCGYCHKTDHAGRDCPNKPGERREKSDRVIHCKNCGEAGHMAKKCPKVSPPPPSSEELPTGEIENIAREERAEDHNEERPLSKGV